MPWSADENREWVQKFIDPSDVVLDVGAGAAIWADLLKHKVARMDAVEIYEPYIGRFGLKEKYDGVYLGDFRTLAIPTNIYDVIILGDVLNHFTQEDALLVWEKARRIVGEFGTVILSAPIIPFPQGPVDGNVHEAHLSQFDMEYLKALSGVTHWQQGEVLGSVIAEGTESPTAPDVTVLITTIPIRKDRLGRALTSVEGQSLKPGHVIVQEDTEKIGAPGNRDNGIANVKTKYVALLDDDDFFYSDHLETLYRAAIETDADIVYSWFDVDGGTDPFPMNFGKPWDPKNPIQTTVTLLAKTDTIRKAGGYSTTIGLNEEQLATYAQGNTVGEDFRMVFSANQQGAKIVHVPKRTWAYCHWEHNTSGRPDRW